MDNIIICGCTGTGKTTISQTICKELGLKYINNWTMFKEMGIKKMPSSKMFAKMLSKIIETNKGIVFDLEMSVLPNDFKKSNLNCEVYYLGISEPSREELFERLVASNKNELTPKQNLKKAKYMLKCGKKLKKQCKKEQLPYFEITEDRENCIKNIANTIIKKHHKQ